jgi:predicted alpha/beta-hydrolase family hydrolase
MIHITSNESRVPIPGMGEVSAVSLYPPDAQAQLVLAHGAGAGMRHPFLQSLSEELALAGVATFRYQFPYMEQKRRAPDQRRILVEVVRAAINAARQRAPDVPLFAGGKSMGGRMTSLAASQHLLDSVRGLVFVGFPLHPPNKPGIERAEHLNAVKIPMLFLQGTRDTFARLNLLRPVCEHLGKRATLHLIETADHSFKVLEKAGRTHREIMQELAETTAKWMRSAQT